MANANKTFQMAGFALNMGFAQAAGVHFFPLS